MAKYLWLYTEFFKSYYLQIVLCSCILVEGSVLTLQILNIERENYGINQKCSKKMEQYKSC